MGSIKVGSQAHEFSCRCYQTVFVVLNFWLVFGFCFFRAEIKMKCHTIENTKSLCSEVSTRETRLLKTQGCLSSKQEMFSCQEAGMDVVNSLVTCAIYRARLYLIPQILMFVPEASSLDLCGEHRFSVNRTHPHGRCHMTDGVVRRSLLYLYSQATSAPPGIVFISDILSRPLSSALFLRQQSHLYGRGYMCFEKCFNVIMS